MRRMQAYVQKKSLDHAEVGWFGIPGRQGGHTHCLVDDKPLCGHRPSLKAQLQINGRLSEQAPECRSCQNIIAAMRAAADRDRRHTIESHGLLITARTWGGYDVTKPRRCTDLDKLGSMLKELLLDSRTQTITLSMR